LREQLGLVPRTQDMYLGHRYRIQELLDHRECAGEAPRGIYDVKSAESLGIVVLGDGGRALEVTVDTWDRSQAYSFSVHDCAASLEEVAGFSTAGGETGVGEFLVFDCEVLEHAVIGGYCGELCEVDFAELFDVDWSTVLE